MKQIFIINGWQIYAQAKGQFNKSAAERIVAFFAENTETEIRQNKINQSYTINK